MKVTGQVIGDADVRAKLANVSKAVRTKILRKAIGEGCKPVMKQMKINAKAIKDTGLTAKAVGRKVKVYRSGVAVGIVGVRKGFGRMVTLKSGRQQYRDPAKTAHLAEFGTRRSKASPFVRPAWDSTKGTAQAKVAETLKIGVEEAAR